MTYFLLHTVYIPFLKAAVQILFLSYPESLSVYIQTILDWFGWYHCTYPSTYVTRHRHKHREVSGYSVLPQDACSS